MVLPSLLHQKWFSIHPWRIPYILQSDVKETVVSWSFPEVSLPGYQCIPRSVRKSKRKEEDSYFRTFLNDWFNIMLHKHSNENIIVPRPTYMRKYIYTYRHTYIINTYTNTYIYVHIYGIFIIISYIYTNKQIYKHTNKHNSSHIHIYIYTYTRT